MIPSLEYEGPLTYIIDSKAKPQANWIQHSKPGYGSDCYDASLLIAVPVSTSNKLLKAIWVFYNKFKSVSNAPDIVLIKRVH